MKFRFGIEHEVAFLHPNGQYADYANTSFSDFDAIVARLPKYAQDYRQLRIGDAGIKLKRWYIEGFERFSESGEVTDCPPKGIEIRTTIHDTVAGAVGELKESFSLLAAEASKVGFTPAMVSFHPQRSEFSPSPPLNTYEQQRRQESPEMQTAHIPMLTQGPDLNLSAEGLSPAQLIDVGRKLTFYSPWIIPFSYSAPFYRGNLWDGLSVRTFYRTGTRPATMVFLEKEADLIESQPSLTQPARVPAEAGRIEFKAFDSCGDFDLYASLLVLLKGLVLDNTLSDRATVPNAAAHQHSAQRGFADEAVFAGATDVLAAARQALEKSWLGDRLPLEQTSFEHCALERLEKQLQQRTCRAIEMQRAYQKGDTINKILREGYKARVQSPV